MPEYSIELWTTSIRRIPATSVQAETAMEARALGLDELRVLGAQFNGETQVDAKLERDNAETVAVRDVVEWARTKGRTFVTRNNLTWLLTFAGS